MTMHPHTSMISHILGLIGLDGTTATLSTLSSGALVGIFFLAGLLGSVAHCSRMCGPLVGWRLNQALSKMNIDDITPTRRLLAGVLPLYHLGRLLTYTILALGLFWFHQSLQLLGLISHFPFLRYLSPLLFLFMAFAFAFTFILRMGRFIPFLADVESLFRKALFCLGEVLSSTRLMRYFSTSPLPFSSFFIGLLAGLLPCGFLYGVFGLSLLFPSSFWVFIGVFAFGLGTAIPLIIFAGVGSFGLQKRAIAFWVFSLLYLWGAVAFYGMASMRFAMILKAASGGM